MVGTVEQDGREDLGKGTHSNSVGADEGGDGSWSHTQGAMLGMGLGVCPHSKGEPRRRSGLGDDWK